MKKFLFVMATVFMFAAVDLHAAPVMSATANSEPGGATVQNTKIKTQANTGSIQASGNSDVTAAGVDIAGGSTIQNSNIDAKANTGSVRASGNSTVNAGGVKVGH